MLLPLLLACSSPEPADTGAGDEPTVDPLAWAVDAPGPYQAGHLRLQVTRTTVLGNVRTTPVEVWYPTEATAGEEVRYLDLYVDPEALGGAEPAPPVHEGGYPVMLYSHGYQGFGGTSAFLMRYLASHGWVAIAPDHVGNTLTDTVEPLATAHDVERPGDLSAALDAVIDGDMLAGPLQADRVAVSGHSHGVLTAWSIAGASFDNIEAACAGEGGLAEGSCTDDELAAFQAGLGDDRVVEAVLLAGSIRRSLFGDTGHRSTHADLLSLSGSADQVGADDQFDTVDQLDLTWIELEGACHQTFALGTCDTLDTDLGYAIVQTWTLAWLRGHLLGDDSVAAILDGSQPVSEVESYHHRTE